MLLIVINSSLSYILQKILGVKITLTNLGKSDFLWNMNLSKVYRMQSMIALQTAEDTMIVSAK